MDRVFEHSRDVHVRNTFIYVEDGVGFTDNEMTNPVYNDTLVDLFHKGLLIFDTGVLYKPTSMEIVEGSVVVNYIKFVGAGDPIVYTATMATITGISELPLIPEVGEGEPEAGEGEPEAGEGEPEAGEGEPEVGEGEPEVGEGEP